MFLPRATSGSAAIGLQRSFRSLTTGFRSFGHNRFTFHIETLHPTPSVMAETTASAARNATAIAAEASQQQLNSLASITKSFWSRRSPKLPAASSNSFQTPQ